MTYLLTPQITHDADDHFLSFASSHRPPGCHCPHRRLDRQPLHLDTTLESAPAALRVRRLDSYTMNCRESR